MFEVAGFASRPRSQVADKDILALNVQPKVLVVFENRRGHEFLGPQTLVTLASLKINSKAGGAGEGTKSSVRPSMIELAVCAAVLPFQCNNRQSQPPARQPYLDS